MAKRGYVGASFYFCQEGVLVITSTGSHISPHKEFLETTDNILNATVEKRGFFIEPKETLDMGVSNDT